MVARYAPPISYNFLNLIRLDEQGKRLETIFEKVILSYHLVVSFFLKKMYV
jgi:hypothetical protein